MSPAIYKGLERDIIILLGAGASAEFGYPVTKTFLDKLGGALTKETLEFLDYLRRLQNVKDIEHIVEILDSLTKVDSVSKTSSLHKFFERYRRYVNFGTKDKSVPFQQGYFEWRHVVDLAQALEKEIVRLTFSEYGRKPQFSEKIGEYYGKFFSIVQQHKKDKSEFEVFTTNYDSLKFGMSV